MSETAIAAPALVRRYERRTSDSESYDDACTFEIFYVDRLTGREVLRYDGADPANTNPAYGAEPDSEIFARKGLDLDEEVEVSRCVVPVPAHEARFHERMKQGLAEREAEEEAAWNVFDVIDEGAAERFRFDRDHWLSDEETVLAPALERAGYRDASFYMIEQDSFGPLIRGVVATDSEGKRVRFYYG